MRSQNQHKSSFIASIASEFLCRPVFGLFFLVLGVVFVTGCGLNIPKESTEKIPGDGANGNTTIVDTSSSTLVAIDATSSEPWSEIIIGKVFYQWMDKKQIQSFLDSQPGILKSYQENYYDSHINTGAQAIERSADSLMAGAINPRILIVLMELKSHAISDPNKTEQDMRNVFGVTQTEYDRYLASFGVQEKLSANFLTQQLDYVVNNILAPSNGDIEKILFKNGVEITPNSTINNETFAIQKMLAYVADSRAQWDLWVSKKDGSFYQIYNKWFGNSLEGN